MRFVVQLCLLVAVQADNFEMQYKESHFLTTEFRYNFISSLINGSTSYNDVENSTEPYLLQNNPEDLLSESNWTFMTRDSNLPFKYQAREYYFSTFSFNLSLEKSKDSELQWYCSYIIGSTDKELTTISNEDGDKINKIHYVCETGTECCGLDCCGDDVVLNITIVAAISGTLLFLLICNIIVGFNKRRGKKGANHSVTYEVRNDEAVPQLRVPPHEEADIGQIHIRTEPHSNFTQESKA